MKLFVWDNDAGDYADDSSFNTGVAYNLAGRYSSGAHSGGFVVLTDTLEDAIDRVISELGEAEKLRAETRDIDKLREYLAGSVIEMPIDEPRVVYFGNGNC